MSNDKLGTLFERSIARRQTLLEEFAAARLVDGIGDGLSDIFIDKFATSAIVHIHREQSENELIKFFIDTPLWSQCGVENVYIRPRGKNAAQNAEELPPASKGNGKNPFWIEEHGVSYQIDPIRHINAGFFLDMRDVRRCLKSISAGKRVLNLFCYTGSLGLAALVGGAREVTQVDISKGILSWAKENLEHNHALHSQGTMRFIPEDSKVFLEREIRRVEKGSERHDIIVIDPPSFSRSKRGTFKVERDLVDLISMVIKIAAPQGELFVTTNLTSVHPQSLIDEIRHSCGANLKGARFDELLPPADFSATLGASIAMRGVRIQL